jgi:hypothetical protein
MVYFQNKKPNLGKFWRVLQWKVLVYFMDIGSILWSFLTFCGHLVFNGLSPFWYIVPRKIWQSCSLHDKYMKFGCTTSRYTIRKCKSYFWSLRHPTTEIRVL